MLFLLPSPYTLELCFHSDFFLLDKFVSSAQLNCKLFMREYITAAMLSLCFSIANLIYWLLTMYMSYKVPCRQCWQSEQSLTSAPTSWTYLVTSLVSVTSLSSPNQPTELDASTLYKYKFLQP